MPDTSISHHNDLPAKLRGAGLYTYLNTHHQSYWRHAVDVAHDLLNRFNEQHDGERFKVYYQDQFSADFLAALKQTDLAPEAKLLGPFELNRSLLGTDKDNDQNHLGYGEALSELRAGPRGMALVYKSVYEGGSHWEASVHCGGGYISGCNTMAKTSKPATYEAIRANVLSYESYLARKQAECEQVILKNYARINELSLRPGTCLQDVEINLDYKQRRMRFVILAVHENGQIMLGEGKMRGSSKIFSATIDAIRIKAENILPNTPPSTKHAPSDKATLALF